MSSAPGAPAAGSAAISPAQTFSLARMGRIAALQYFTEAVVAASVASGQATTGGGNSALLGYPEGSTLTYAQWLYVMGFKNYYLGYASALAVVMFAVSLGVTLILLRRARSLVFGAEGTR